jgi:pyruvate ferredoxin oxidoreductase beta subunit
MVVGVGVHQHYTNFKRQQYQAMQDAKPVIREVCREFAEMFGRKYDLVEAYKTDDAEMVVVAMGSVVSIFREKIDEYGSVVSIFREKIDEYRAQGKKIGLLKIRVFRPFPEEEVRTALSGAGKVLVIDRACSPGATYGVSCIEVMAALHKSKAMISNMIISTRDVGTRTADEILNKWFKSDGEWVDWFQAEDDERAATFCGWDNYEKLARGEQVTREVVKDGESPLGKGTVGCIGCLSAGAIRQAMEVFGKKTVVVSNAGCGMAFSNFYPMTAWRVPYFFFTYSHAGAAASGIEVAMKLKGIKADLVLIAGDGALYDIGLQTFSAALERGHRIIYICYDNQAYMNTGVQSSGSTPYAAKTKTTLEGRKSRVKNIEQIVAAHGDIYIATASPAYPSDLKRKLKKARELDKPSFIHIICPCPPGWEYDPAFSIEISRLAVETGTVVLYEYENGELTLNKMPKVRKPVKEYLMKQGRFSHLTKAQVAEIQAEVESNLGKLTAGNLV